jgi:hypothetical protein
VTACFDVRFPPFLPFALDRDRMAANHGCPAESGLSGTRNIPDIPCGIDLRISGLVGVADLSVFHGEIARSQKPS